jgi:putative ABC transport system permease protein
MLKNYIKIAFRNLLRQKLYSLINITGLSIGIACFLLISLWVFDELSYDRFHENKDRIYRINTMSKEMGLITSSSWRLGPAMIDVYPEIEAFTRLWPWGRSLIKYKNKSFDESSFYLADPAFFHIFSFEFIHGSPETALQDKHGVVLTEKTAKRYFGDDDPLGKTIFIRQYDHDFEVSGVIEDIPTNSSIRFDLIARVDLMPLQRLNSWEFTGYTCVLLNEEIDIETMDQKIYDFYREYVDAEADLYPFLQPLTDVHLYQDGTPGLIKMVRYFSIIAIFILLIACINFMNLRTARATKRAIEVGIRKVVGANRRQLIIQFLSESLLISIISLAIGILLVELILPAFNQVAMKQLQLFSGQIADTILFLSAATIITGLISGSYPAIYLSSFLPVKILKGKSFSSDFGNTSRKALTIFQFAISIGLIICILTWQEQLHFIQNKDIGIKKDFVINLIHNQDLVSKFEPYRTDLLKNRSIRSVTSSASTPFNIGSFIGVNWEGHFDQESVIMPYNMVEYDFFKTFDMKFIDGRSFSREISTDKTQACVINQSAARLMGFDSSIGKEIYFDHPAFEESYKYVKIIGVVNDFHAHSLHKEIAPSIFRMHEPYLSYVYLKIQPGKITQTLDYIKETTNVFAPDYPFRFEFMDKTYNRLYEMEIRMGKIINIFTLLAIFISCLGLFGLASYTIEKRTKEIGIRKVLGASVPKITSMLSLEFLKWVALANLIAWPVAWLFMRQWLYNFVYRIDLNLWIFLGAGSIGLVLALLTVIFQSTKAALSNPVEALRYE